MITQKKKLELVCIPITQKNTRFYLTRIKFKDLLENASIHIRSSWNVEKKYKDISNLIDKMTQGKLSTTIDDFGNQRIADLKRAEEIIKFLKEDTETSYFPSNVVVSLNTIRNSNNQNDNDDFFNDVAYTARNINYNKENSNSNVEQLYDDIDFSDELPFVLEVDTDRIDMIVVDGQHRILALALDNINGSNNDNFELPIALFLELNIANQAKLFADINGNQKPISKSLITELRGFAYNELNIDARCHNIVKYFENKENSPLYHRIKMLGAGPGAISQSAFADELKNYLFPRKLNKQRSFLADADNETIIKLLLIYLTTISNKYPHAWKDTNKYLLLRSSGFGAWMKALYYFFIYSKTSDRKFGVEFLEELLENAPPESYFERTTHKGLAGQAFQSQLSKTIIATCIFKIDNDIKIEGDELERINKKIKDLEINYLKIYKSNI